MQGLSPIHYKVPWPRSVKSEVEIVDVHPSLVPHLIPALTPPCSQGPSLACGKGVLVKAGMSINPILVLLDDGNSELHASNKRKHDQSVSLRRLKRKVVDHKSSKD